MRTADNSAMLAQRLSECNIPYKTNEPLSHHCTFRIGGAAKLFVSPATEEELAAVIALSKECSVRYFVAGKGSNIVYPDGGFDGAVISTLSLAGIKVNGNRIYADAGASFTELAVVASKHSLTGLEFAYGIPGSVGGAVYMNAGAYDGEIAGVVVRSRYYDSETCTFGETVGDDHSFGYRDSVYRHHPERIIIGAEFLLKEGNKADIEAKMTDFITRRKTKQPLEYPSAGSAFKRYPGRYTGEMIEKAGLKGFSIGGAQISEKHAGFIINKGGATAADVRALSDHIRATIRGIHGIEIESEIIFVE